MPKQQTPAPQQDLYPDVSEWKFDGNVESALRKNGVNVTGYLSKFNEAVKANDFSTKAQLLNQFADWTDKVQGGTAARNWLNSMGPTQPQPQASVGAGQAVFGTIKNGFLDMVEALPQLAVAGHNLTMAGRGAPLDIDGWTKAQKGIADVFGGMKTYVSENYTKPLATYDKEKGVEFDINLDNTIGFLANAAQYVLPGMIAGKAAQFGVRGALKGAEVMTAEALAAQGQALAQAGKTATTVTGITSFLQTFPLYQREAMSVGANVAEATLFALPVAAVNSVIETANMPSLTKALGLSEKATQEVVKKYTQDALKEGLQSIAGQKMSANMLMEVAEKASKDVLGAIRDPATLKPYAQLWKTAAKRIGKGATEQGVPEMGEEFMQAGVENFAKLVFNNLKEQDKTGKFEDPTWSSFAYDAIYSMAGALVVGTGMGTFAQSKQADPTVYGVVASNVRQAMRQGLPVDTLLDPDGEKSLPILKAIKAQFQKGDIDENQYTDLVSKVGRMAGVAQQFADVQTFSDQDTWNMFKVDESRQIAKSANETVAGVRSELDNINTSLQSGSLTGAERIKLELTRNSLAKQLGPLVDTPDGQMYTEEVRANERTGALENIIGQVMDQYTSDVPRDAIRTFFEDNLNKWNRDYQIGKVYPDDFQPVQMLENPDTQQVLVTDANGRIFRQVQKLGGNVREAMRVDEDGTFVPSKREPVSYDVHQPVADATEHVALYQRVRDQNDPLNLQPYKEPDNSTDNGWLLDGEDIALRLDAAPIKYTKEGLRNKNQSNATKQAELEAVAWLSDSTFLADKPAYKEQYKAIKERLLQSTVPPVNEQTVTEENAQPIGGNVDLLAEDQVNLDEQDLQQQKQQYDEFLNELLNDQSGDAESIKAKYAGTIQQIADQEELERAIDAAIASGGTDVGAIEAVVRTLEQANPESAEVAREYREKSGKLESIKTSRKPLRKVWEYLLPRQQQEAIELVNMFETFQDGSGLTPAWSAIYQFGGLSPMSNARKWFTENGYGDYLDRSNKNGGITAGYRLSNYQSDDSNAQTIDQVAEEITGQTGIYVTEQDIVDWIIQFPYQFDGEGNMDIRIRQYGIDNIKDKFKEITGRQLTTSTANVVKDLAANTPVPSGIESITLEAESSADEVWDELDEADRQIVRDMVAQYKEQYGDNWMIEILRDSQSFPPLPQSISDLIANAVEKVTFDNQTQQYNDVRNYLEQQAGDRSGSETGNSGPDSGGSEQQGQNQLQSTGPTAESVELQTEALADKARALSNQTEAESGTGINEQALNDTLAETDQLTVQATGQINSEAAIDPRINEAVAPYDIAIADLQQQKRQIETQIARRSTALNQLFPEIPRDGNQRNMFEQTGEEVRAAAEQAIQNYRDEIAAIDRRIDEQQSLKERAIDQALNAPQQELFTDTSPESTIVEQEIQRLAESPVQKAVVKYGLPEQYGSQYINRLRDIISNQLVSPAKVDLIADRLSGAPLSYDALANLFGIDPNTVAGSETMSFLMDRANDKTLPSILRAVNELNGVAQTPQFSLPMTDMPNIVGNRVLQNAIDKFSEIIPNVPIVANVVGFENALSASGAREKLAGRRPRGFYWQGKVYLDPTVATEETALHEFGHVWAEVAVNSFPEQYRQGVGLVRDSKYYQQLLRDPYYRTLPAAQLEQEALAQAIGDKGVQFITQGRKSAFRQFLSDLWSGIKRLFGVDAGVNMEDMTLDQFVSGVVDQMVSGEMNAQIQAPAVESPVQQRPQPVFALSSPVLNGSLKSTADLKNDAVNMLTMVPTGVSIDILTRGKARWTTKDKQYIAQVKAKTGYELTGANKFKWTRPKGFFYTTKNGGAVIDTAEIGAAIEDGFLSSWNAAGNKGWLFRQMFTKLKGNTNLNTFISYLDDKKGSLRELIQGVQRESGKKADYVQITLKGLREQAEAALAPFSRLSGNSAETVRSMTIKTYDFDADGNVQEVEKTVPVSVGMQLALLTRTQYKSYGTSSHVADTKPKAEDLYINESTGRRTRKVYGAFYADPDTGETTQFLLSKTESDALIDRFETGVGGYSGETKAYQALKDYFNNKEVADTLEDEANQLNPDREFKRLDSDYTPITTIKDGSDAKELSRGRQRTFEENRRLIEREGPASAILLQDPVTVMRQYDSAVSDVIAYGKLIDNLGHLRDAIQEKYQGEQKTAIVEFLDKYIGNIQNHKQKVAKQYQENPGLRFVDGLMRRYGRAVLNSILSPLKQTITFASAIGLNGLIDTRFLKNSEVLGILSKLTLGAYRDITARGDIDISGNTNRGLEGVGGIEILEKPYIDKLLGRDITDDAERLAHVKQWATVINRLLGNATQFIDGAQFDDFGMNQKTLTNAQKRLRALDQWADNYFSTGNQRADRAVVFAWIKAAELQGQSKGLTGQALDAYTADLVTNALYEKYSLSNLAERTPMQLSESFFLKMLGLYSAQQQKIANLLLRAVNDWIRTDPDSAEGKTAREHLYGVLSWAVMFNAIGVATISALARALMASLTGKEPDKGEDIAEQIAWDTLRNVTGLFPNMGTAAANYLISTNDTLNSGGRDTLVDMPALETIQGALDSLTLAKNALMEEDEGKSDKALDALLRKVPDVIAQTTGIPVNIKRLIASQLK